MPQPDTSWDRVRQRNLTVLCLGLKIANTQLKNTLSVWLVIIQKCDFHRGWIYHTYSASLLAYPLDLLQPSYFVVVTTDPSVQVPQQLFLLHLWTPQTCASTTCAGLANSDKSSSLRHKIQAPSDSFFSFWIFSTVQWEMIGKSFPGKPSSLYFFKKGEDKIAALWGSVAKQNKKKSSDLPLLIFLGLPNNSTSEFHFVSSCLQWPICAAQLSVSVFLYLSTSFSNNPPHSSFCSTSLGYCCPIMTCLNRVLFNNLLCIMWSFVKFLSGAQ